MSEYREILETTDDGRYRVILIQDADCESPIATDAWVSSVIVRTYSRSWGYEWDSPADRDPGDRRDAMRYFENEATMPRSVSAEDAFKRYMRIFHGIEVVETHWGSRRDCDHALAWVEPSERSRAGLDTHPDYPDLAIIEGEVGEYNRWADGDTWGYVVQKRVTWQSAEAMQAWEDTDESCWGFIGHEYAEREAREALVAVAENA